VYACYICSIPVTISVRRHFLQEEGPDDSILRNDILAHGQQDKRVAIPFTGSFTPPKPYTWGSKNEASLIGRLVHIPSSSLPLQGTIIAFGPIGPPPAPLRYFIKKHETPEESHDQDPDIDHESSTLKPLENYEIWTIEETRENLIYETGTARPNPLKRTITHPTSTPAAPEQPRTRSNSEKHDNKDKQSKQKIPDSRESSRNQEESTARSLALITTSHRRPTYENLPEDNIDHEDYTQTLREHETRIRLATQETDPYIASILSELPKLKKGTRKPETRRESTSTKYYNHTS